jgi:hypothetical protein
MSQAENAGSIPFHLSQDWDERWEETKTLKASIEAEEAAVREEAERRKARINIPAGDKALEGSTNVTLIPETDTHLQLF